MMLSGNGVRVQVLPAHTVLVGVVDQVQPPLEVLLCEKSPIRSRAVGVANCDEFDWVSEYPSQASQKGTVVAVVDLGMPTTPPLAP